MNRYLVTATLKYAACYNKGYEMTIVAKNAADAVKRARVEVRNMGHTTQDGPLSYRAVKES